MNNDMEVELLKKKVAYLENNLTFLIQELMRLGIIEEAYDEGGLGG